MPDLYRKIPVVIEAEQFTLVGNEYDLAEWCGGRYVEVDAGNRAGKEKRIEIDTLEGTMTANLGDWILKGVHGEFYPCKNEIFLKTYERVEELPQHVIRAPAFEDE